MAENAYFTIWLATPDDVDSLTELHCASFDPQDHVPVILGREYVRAMYRWQASGEEVYNLVADRGGQVIGLLGVCDRPYAWPMFKACLRAFVMSLAQNPLLLLDRRLWQRLFRRSEAPGYQATGMSNHPAIAQIIIGAVDAGSRGKGVFPALVETAKAVSQSRGSSAIRVGVYRTNSPSRGVFEKTGWIELPSSARSDTVSYVAYLDADLPRDLETG